MKCIPAGLSSWGFGRHMVEKARNRGFVFNENKRWWRQKRRERQTGTTKGKIMVQSQSLYWNEEASKNGFEHSDFCVSASDEASCCAVIVRPLEEGHSNQNNAKIRPRSRSQTAVCTHVRKCAHLACPQQLIAQTHEPTLRWRVQKQTRIHALTLFKYAVEGII